MPENYRTLMAEYEQRLPATPEALTAEMRKFVEEYRVDGLFTDNPDLFPR